MERQRKATLGKGKVGQKIKPTYQGNLQYGKASRGRGKECELW